MQTSLFRLERFSPEERKRIHHALEFATAQHAPQRRVGGEPYITHPIAVAQCLIDEFGADAETVIGGLLHDTVEDTGATLEQIEQHFGPAVRFLVDATTDVGKGDGRASIAVREERDIATHKKLEEYAAKDSRAYLIKIADRWHNMKNVRVLRSKNQKRLANETLAFHVPIARRLGFVRQADDLERTCRDVLRRVEDWERRGAARRRYLS